VSGICDNCGDFATMKSIVRVAISALLVGTTLARPQFASLVPNGNAGSDASSGLSCAALGHEGCVGGATLNAFGTALKAAGKTWTKECTTACIVSSSVRFVEVFELRI
jgi:hypothetical protein